MKSGSYTRCFMGVSICCALVSCNAITKKDKPQKHLAKVFDTYLNPSDVEGVIPKGSSPSDSARIMNEYVRQWMQEQVLLHQAITNLDPKEIDFSHQIEDYKNSLIIYEYEKELVKEKLDTGVAENEVNDYYEKNQKDFQLKNDIVKIVYVKVNKKAPGQDKLKGWIKSDNVKDKEKLAGYCNQYASNFFLNDNVWLMFDDVLKEIPIQTYNNDLFLQKNNNGFVMIDDTADTYYLGIKGYMIKNSPSPLSFEKDNIKKIILNKRKMELIENMKENSFEQAQLHNNTQVYK